MNHDLNTTRYLLQNGREVASLAEMMCFMPLIATQSRHRARFRFMCRSCAVSSSFTTARRNRMASTDLQVYVDDTFTGDSEVGLNAGFICSFCAGRRRTAHANRDVIQTFYRLSKGIALILSILSSIFYRCSKRNFHIISDIIRTFSRHVENNPNF